MNEDALEKRSNHLVNGILRNARNASSNTETNDRRAGASPIDLLSTSHRTDLSQLRQRDCRLRLAKWMPHCSSVLVLLLLGVGDGGHCGMPTATRANRSRSK